MFNHILPCSSTKATLAHAGGKGANLARLVRAGFAVPPCFIITTDAYRTFVEVNQLQPRILTLVRAISVEDTAVLENTSTSILTPFKGSASH